MNRSFILRTTCLWFFATYAGLAAAASPSPPPSDSESIRALIAQKEKEIIALRKVLVEKTDPASRARKRALNQLGMPTNPPPASPSPEKANPCEPQRFFIRANSLDNYLYKSGTADKAKGASISYNNNYINNSEILSVDGMVSYVVFANLCPSSPSNNSIFWSGYVIAPFVQGNGSLTRPKVKNENSTLKIGITNQFELTNRASFFAPRQVFTIAPYAMTDYRGEAQAAGMNAYWDLYDPYFHLGGYVKGESTRNLGWFLQLRGEADIYNVNNIGLTQLSKTSYSWIGGTARLNMLFLPDAIEFPELIRNRFSFIGSLNYFNDLQSGKKVLYYTALLRYKLTADDTASISFEYDQGTKKESMVEFQQYLVTLNYAY